MGIEVCDLRRKFQLLKTYGCISSIGDIAKRVGRAEKTVWSWADGNSRTLPNRVPSKNFEAFRDVMIEVLKDHTSPERTAELMFAPASHLEAELRRGQLISLMDLIEDEADTSAIKLIRYSEEQINERGLIETQLDQQPSGPVHEVKQGEWFRLLVEKDLSAYNIFALQHGGGLWGAVPSSIEATTGHAQFPGFDVEGKPTFMRERNALGLNTFIVMATRQPLPSGVIEMTVGAEALDHAALSTLADFVRQQPNTGRQLFFTHLIIE